MAKTAKYTAKHAAPKQHSTTGRRLGGLVVASAAAIAAMGAAAPAAHADDSVWDRVAACESSGNWSINTGNGYYGGLQFYQPTWVGYGGQAFASYAHYASKAEQIAIARRVLYSQGPGAWPVCSVYAGLTRTNGGADPNAMPSGYSAPAPDPVQTSAPAPAPSSGETVTRYVTGSAAAYVRSGPGFGYRVVDTVARGTKVTGTFSGAWLRIGDGRYVGSSMLSAGSTGSSSGSYAALVVDGIRGPLTNAAIQRWLGTAQTGVFDSTTAKALQRKVGAYPDGIWGPKSQAALQSYLGISRDGSTYMNWRTVVALQKYLNSR